ncbi:ATP-dependent RecD-like DNA helicase [Lysinibacillus sp. 2017]|uniref:SF1B family DNA helicase RecD2 n=1 Tax=unclassified Lysinibacillus TaxID=2636778 RepID=UPI000D52908E|nr:MULTISPECIES: ATP-dependent RecD-like DNA helicase [unclassified Lysinibacillus]AWE09295.1 ATP-dependent RecD-like DNA helicase [Lysinibacillus sp. 2017]TGN36353.1 ATP-dependent RecD-like DNA helicase [Lysinibacillus sp. S2017]
MAENLNLFDLNKLFILGHPIVTIFHNATNMYSIIRVKIKETNIQYDEKEIIVVGYFPQLAEDELYRFTGHMKSHPKYGMQFQIDTFEKEVPTTEQGVVHYLSSDLFTGIGRKTAELIVEKLGVDAINKILNDPSALDAVPRLNDDKKLTIRQTIEENLGLERVMVRLNEWGFGPQLGMKIYQAYREETINLLTENPYRLIEEVEGVGFIRADELGSKLGITGNHPDRIKAAVFHVLTNAALSEGHVYLDAEQVLPMVKDMLEQSQRIEIPYEAISKACIEMREDSRICGEETRMYLPSLYFSEVGIASKIIELKEKNNTAENFSRDEIRKAIGDIEEQYNVSYAPTQAQAIETALNSSVMILTGGPGTGKTTVVRGLVEVYAELHGLSLNPKTYVEKEEPFPIVLVAPTGRAAKRLAESTGLPAMTIHRLLGFNGHEKAEETEREVTGRLIIIDEMSMVDTWLAHQLLKALHEDVQVVFVGDQDQLPPVGPGQVLKDLLASKQIPTVELTDVYRQAEGSTIIEMAHQIKKGIVPDTLTAKTSDRSFIQAAAAQVTSVVTQIVKGALAKGQAIRDIQVLAPMYRGPAGIDNLNKEIQQLVNPNDGSRKEIVFGDTIYRIGDKVLQLVNQPENNVFNGDMGEVIAIIRAKETVEKQDLLIVSYDGIEVTYQRHDLNQITLAYCCSIHKSQGSEFQTVIMPVVRGYSKMLRRNLLYTGITRAKNFLILCGEPDVLAKGLAKTDDLMRYTSLMARLNPALSENVAKSVKETDEKEIVVMEKVEAKKANSEEQLSLLNVSDSHKIGETLPNHLTTETAPYIHPLIGMDNISPYDFIE